MRTRSIQLLRWFTGLVWTSLLICLLAVVTVVHLAPASGHSALVVRGGSMEPAIPLGSVILISQVDRSAVAVGDVVTVRADNLVVYSHRVIRVVETGTGFKFETKGDANEGADPHLVPARAVIGRVDLHIPFAGYVIALLATPSGVISLLSLMAGLLLAHVLLEGVGPRPEPATTAGTTARPSVA